MHLFVYFGKPLYGEAGSIEWKKERGGIGQLNAVEKKRRTKPPSRNWSAVVRRKSVKEESVNILEKHRQLRSRCESGCLKFNLSFDNQIIQTV